MEPHEEQPEEEIIYGPAVPSRLTPKSSAERATPIVPPSSPSTGSAPEQSLSPLLPPDVVAHLLSRFELVEHDDRPVPPRGPAGSDPDCPICRGFGFVRREVPVGHDDFGKSFPCQCYQATYERIRLERYLAASQIPGEEFGHVTFASYALLDGADHESGRLVELWASQGDPSGAVLGGPSLFLHGRQGRGKTALGICALRQIAERQQVGTLYRYLPDLYDDLKRAFNPVTGGLSSGEVFDLVRNTRAVLLDDLGKENPTPWVKETFARLIDYRWRMHLPTIFTSNDPPAKLKERFDAPLLSRIEAMCAGWIIEVRGDRDLRPGGHQ